MQTLTKAEEEIMQVIWQLGPCTVGQIRERIGEQPGREKPAPSTVSTMVRILEDKGFVYHKAIGRIFEYHPRVSKAEYGRSSLQKLVRDYFGGSPNRLVSFLVKDKDISLDDLSKLMDQLDKPQS